MTERNDAFDQLIAERQQEYIDLCRRIIQVPSENPPGNTDEMASFISKVLKDKGVEHDILEPRPGNPIIVSTIGPASDRHLILNAHLDVFPVEDPALWARDPFSGDVDGGCIHGRGASDMKAGLTSSLITYLLLHEHRDQLQNRVSLTLVSDEETGGEWGAKWLLENHPEYIGTGVLNAEPTGLGTTWFGEKGLAWFRLIATGKAGHGSAGRGDNAITRLAEAILAVRPIVDMRGDVPEGMEMIYNAQRNQAIFDLDRTMDALLQQPSMNVGTISGGVKANVTPHHAEAEVDVRIPFNITPEQIYQQATSLVEDIPDVTVVPIRNQSFPATIIQLDDPLLASLMRHATDVTGDEPSLTLCPGATDGRFWRSRGVSTVIYGPSSYGMAAPDEYIEIDDFLNITRVHARTAFDYLIPDGRGGA